MHTYNTLEKRRPLSVIHDTPVAQQKKPGEKRNFASAGSQHRLNFMNLSRARGV
jgi:hypothetical protein